MPPELERTQIYSKYRCFRGLTGFTALEGYFDVLGSILEVGNDVLLLAKWDAYTLFLMSRNRGKQFVWSERGIGSSGEIASLGKARRQGGSSITFVQPLLGHESDRMSSRRPIGTRSFRCIVNHQRMVVYRSWIFGFDSGIPRVTISGRFCDWTRSRGLQI
ncbi:hypothetical protein GQ457_12G013140 [Hibiscus cannabinus]